MQTAKSNYCVWQLSAESADVASMGEITILHSPFRVGRQQDLELTLKVPIVSSIHANLIEADGQLYVEDLNSRNGTFVNGDRVTETTLLQPGDLIQFAHAVFRLSREVASDDTSFNQTIMSSVMDDAITIVKFENMMCNELVEPNLQSVIDLNTQEVVGFEALARGKSPGLESAGQMFKAAEKMQRAPELSDLMRRLAAREYERFCDKIKSKGKKLFLNTHPQEIFDSNGLIGSLELLRNSHPGLELVLEIHESTVTDIEEMKKLSRAVKDLGIEIAYDDFGAGQARFFELIEEPPAYLKFDIRLVKDIHKATNRRVKAIEQLVLMVKNLDIQCIAEGIEVKEDAVICQELGFEFAQGYFYSKPKPIREWF